MLRQNQDLLRSVFVTIQNPFMLSQLYHTACHIVKEEQEISDLKAEFLQILPKRTPTELE